MKVAEKPRVAYILLPKGGSEFDYGEEIHLMGGGFSPDYGIASSQSTVWTSTTRGLLGTGNRLTLTGLPVGSRLITVHVPNGVGGEAIATSEVIIKPPRGSHSIDARSRAPRTHPRRGTCLGRAAQMPNASG